MGQAGAKWDISGLFRSDCSTVWLCEPKKKSTKIRSGKTNKLDLSHLRVNLTYFVGKSGMNVVSCDVINGGDLLCNAEVAPVTGSCSYLLYYLILLSIGRLRYVTSVLASVCHSVIALPLLCEASRMLIKSCDFTIVNAS